MIQIQNTNHKYCDVVQCATHANETPFLGKFLLLIESNCELHFGDSVFLCFFSYFLLFFRFAINDLECVQSIFKHLTKYIHLLSNE